MPCSGDASGNGFLSLFLSLSLHCRALSPSPVPRSNGHNAQQNDTCTWFVVSFFCVLGCDLIYLLIYWWTLSVARDTPSCCIYAIRGFELWSPLKSSHFLWGPLRSSEVLWGHLRSSERKQNSRILGPTKVVLESRDYSNTTVLKYNIIVLVLLALELYSNSYY